MINALKALFILPEEDSKEARQHRVQLAAAALLIETARADFTQDASEEAALEQMLSESLVLPRHEVKALIEAASTRVEEATSLYEFTRVINDHYGPEEKLTLIASMWQVAAQYNGWSASNDDYSATSSEHTQCWCCHYQQVEISAASNDTELYSCCDPSGNSRSSCGNTYRATKSINDGISNTTIRINHLGNTIDDTSSNHGASCTV